MKPKPHLYIAAFMIANIALFIFTNSKTGLIALSFLLVLFTVLSVSPKYKPVTKFRLTLEPLTRGLFYAAVLGIIIFQLPITNNQLPIPLLAAVGLFLLRWLMQILVINLSARRMHLHGFGPLAILGLDIWLPLVNLWMLVIPKRKTKW